MEKVEEEKAAQKTRIYMGGLGKNVTEDDIRKTFSGLGRVDAVDIFRTKGRSFAYLDFIPAAEKSLPKLFSTYNGCMWKGGRLKLEKAKEHYLLRLKREWDDDAKLINTAPSRVDVSDSKPSLEKPKKLQALEKPNIRIFFPKLSKMKSLPFGGSGKHKYSFQRIEVPPLPIHFCDCEEHCNSFHKQKGTPSDTETANGGIREEELGIMESVMKKLFERETHSKDVPDRGKLTEERDSLPELTDIPVDEVMSDPPSDEDNLIINIVAGGKESMQSGNHAQKTRPDNKELKHGRSNTFKDCTVNRSDTSQKKNIESLNMKRKLPLADLSEGNERESVNTKKKKGLPVSYRGQEDQSTEPKARPPKPKINIAWSQKSAWKDLIGKKGDTPFEFSSVVPGVPSKKEEEPDSSNDMLRKSFAKVELPQSSYSVPTMASAEVEQPQSSHFVAGITSKMEEQSRPRNVNVFTCSSDSEKQNTLHGNPASETMQSKEKQGAEAPALASPDDVSIKIARGASWRQKSSWTQLVADANKNSFSISQVIPGISFETQPSQPNLTDVAADTSNAEHQNFSKLDELENTAHGLEVKDRSVHVAPSNVDAISLSKSTVESEKSKVSTVIGNREATALKIDRRQQLIRKPISIADLGETCSFVRNADSLKEWSKAKASVSNSLKKKKRGPEEK